MLDFVRQQGWIAGAASLGSPRLRTEGANGPEKNGRADPPRGTAHAPDPHSSAFFRRSPASRETESAGGIVLIAATLIAIVWANSPWGGAYEHLWETPVTIGCGGQALTYSLHHWINDGLMAVFFFLVGLEIKREFLVGELASLKRAALPIAAALGGMVVPALIYAALNVGGAGEAGWGIPMATDIAFALGVLALLGPRIPLSLKVFLAALAIVDDLGAVLVIAVFYTDAIQWSALDLGFAAAGRAGARQPHAGAQPRRLHARWASCCGWRSSRAACTPRWPACCWP